MPPVAPVGKRSRRATYQASPLTAFWALLVKFRHLPTFIVVGTHFLTTIIGAAGVDPIVTRVGSSSPETFGLAAPLTFGSSLKAKIEPFDWKSVAWLATTVPLARGVFKVMSNWITASPFAGRLRFRTS